MAHFPTRKYSEGNGVTVKRKEQVHKDGKNKESFN